MLDAFSFKLQNICYIFNMLRPDISLLRQLIYQAILQLEKGNEKCTLRHFIDSYNSAFF